jgi:sphinganine-1-phosphate aldolase
MDALAFLRPAAADSSPALRSLERVLAVTGAIIILKGVFSAAKDPKRALSSILDTVLKQVPGAQAAVDAEIEGEAARAVAELFDQKALTAPLAETLSLPAEGLSRDDVITILKALNKLDCHADDANVFAYTYSTGEAGHEEFHRDVTSMFANENALSPMAFPALKRFEVEIVAMAISLLGGDSSGGEHCGTVTSGGTESILLAVKAYRDFARETRGITEPNVVLPRTAHPAFEKAGHYFGVKTVYVDEDQETRRADPDAMRRAVDRNTILLVASAPQYAHGAVDPVREIADIALEKNLPLHVDSCIGGWVLPWVRKLGYDVPDFDFSVPGVTSISADLHKYVLHSHPR